MKTFWLKGNAHVQKYAKGFILLVLYTRMVNKTFLLLGSNLGDKQLYLRTATEQLGLLGTLVRKSAVYESVAWGVQDQPNYWNQAIELETNLSAEELLRQLNRIERELGRERRARWESRVIDIDILYYNYMVLETDTLTTPHPRLSERRFVLVPLTEIAPDFVHPVLQLTNLDLLARCPDQLAVERVN